jgi:hypothetical protein
VTKRQRPTPERRSVEAAIDHVLEDSFPASDPPQWDSLAARSRDAEPGDRPAEKRPAVR